MRIAIVGGTGTVGREVAAELHKRGHDVRVLARHAPQWPVDLLTGERARRRPEGRRGRGERRQRRPASCWWTARSACCAPAPAAPSRGGLGRRHRPRAVRLPQGQARPGAARARVGRAVHDRARDAVPPVRGRSSCSARRGSASSRSRRCRCSRSTRARWAARWPTRPRPSRPARSRSSPGPRCSACASWWSCGAAGRGSHALALTLPLPGAKGRALRAGALTEPGAWRGSVRFGEWLAAAA